ncbi:ATP-binding cassette domain-containing protein [Candidatus Dependentiae bacterium]|nr:ATP-binding cassette domain-containing protein [Candidatus Dependentiae bacterium]
MNKTEILNVENLNVSFGDEEIIKNLSFSINEKDVFVILGPNGAGKTTLLRALLKIIPYTGKIEWKTSKISYLPPQEFFARKDLPPLNIKEFFKFKKVSQKQINNFLNLVGLEKTILNKEFTKLSTGQFQRTIIAWALVSDPKVLLFDEPTSGIDVGGEETIYSLLHKFWTEKNLTIILVTHDLNIVWEHAQKVLCLNKKKICQGSPEQILTPENLKKLYGTKIKFYKHVHGEN